MSKEVSFAMTVRAFPSFAFGAEKAFQLENFVNFLPSRKLIGLYFSIYTPVQTTNEYVIAIFEN